MTKKLLLLAFSIMLISGTAFGDDDSKKQKTDRKKSASANKEIADVGDMSIKEMVAEFRDMVNRGARQEDLRELRNALMDAMRRRREANPQDWVDQKGELGRDQHLRLAIMHLNAAGMEDAARRITAMVENQGENQDRPNGARSRGGRDTGSRRGTDRGDQPSASRGGRDRGEKSARERGHGRREGHGPNRSHEKERGGAERGRDREHGRGSQRDRRDHRGHGKDHDRRGKSSRGSDHDHRHDGDHEHDDQDEMHEDVAEALEEIFDEIEELQERLDSLEEMIEDDR